MVGYMIYEAQVPQGSTREILEASYDMNLSLLLRNMQGSTPELGYVIRDVAERAMAEDRPLEVLEVGNGLPMKTLYFQGNALRQHGDFMLCGNTRQVHEKPEVHSTMIADQDYVELVMTSEDLFVDGRDVFFESSVVNFLNAAMSYPAAWYDTSPAAKSSILDAYHEKQTNGVIATHTGDPVQVLRQMRDTHKRYDLIFSNLAEIPSTAEKLRYLQALQSCLAQGGCAFMPLEWWRPGGIEEGSGVVRTTLVSDTVRTQTGDTPLGVYVADQFPDAFRLVHYPGATTLMAMGTDRPVHIPEVSASRAATKWDFLGRLTGGPSPRS